MSGAVDPREPAPLADRVTVTGIEAFGRHGVFDHEKADGQRFTCDVTLWVDTRRAAARDDLAEAVDYGAVAQAVHAVLAGPPRDLIEAVAADVADAVLTDARVLAVDVTIHKPQAPITVPFADVTVAVHRSRADALVAARPAAPVPVALALGSNLGDRAQLLAAAVRALATTPGIDVTAVSPVVESDPVGGPEQGAFLNAVVLARTTLSPLALLHACQDVEVGLDRRREVRWGPRTIDVDVLVHGDLAVDTWALTLPHPRAAGRPFVLLPWALVDPDGVLPDLHGPRRVADLLREQDGDVTAAVPHAPGVRVVPQVRIAPDEVPQR